MADELDTPDIVAARVQAAAREALVEAYRRIHERGPENGYVGSVRENLVEGVAVDLFCEDFAGAGGHELTRPDPTRPPKFCAVYSSAALAVNTFAPWKRDISRLTLPQHREVESLRFEGRCPSGLKGTPPTLDVLLYGQHRVVGIESKCLEYLGPHTAHFAEVYFAIGPPRCQSPWFEELRALQRQPHRYGRLDAAQLIKHYLGLAHTYPALPVTLLYLFWEPANWADFPPCTQHRSEVAAFAKAVSGDRVGFEWATYRDLLTHWEQDAGCADWVAAHVAALRARYDVQVGDLAEAARRTDAW